MRALIVILLMLLPLAALADQRQASADVSVCFTPGENCETRIVIEIDRARSDIRLQAYGLTSTAILEAFRRALARGVTVEAILDETNEQKRYGAARYLLLAGAHVWIDDAVAIAHNKIIVIDGRTVVGGSFNFTKAAQRRNAENVTFIRSREVAGWYLDNWQARLAVSRPYDVAARRPQ